jgi:hypothetical protein
MSEPQWNAAVDGQEFDIAAANMLGQVSGLADDRVLAEILRLTPFDGANTYKTILPYGSLPIEGAGPATPNNGTVQPSGSANGSILVQPFRAVVGSRVAAATNALQNWRDIRSSVFVGPNALAQTIALAPNASGQPRWDLVYATLTVDVPSLGTTKRIKPPSGSAVNVTTVTTALLNPVVVSVLAGAPGAVPAIPALPLDGSRSYNIAIAAVRVPAGFGAGSTVVTADIRDQVAIASLQSPTLGAPRIRPATGNTDQKGTYGPTNAAGPGYWNPATSGQRPGVFMPPGMMGGDQVLVAVDVTDPANPSHHAGDVVDDSIDWRNRITKVYAAIGGNGVVSFKFAMDNTANPGTGSGSRFPTTMSVTGNSWGTSPAFMQLSNTFGPDAALVAGAATLFGHSSTGASGDMPSGAQIGLYVSMADGVLRWFNNGTASTSRFFFWVEATGSFPNA